MICPKCGKEYFTDLTICEDCREVECCVCGKIEKANGRTNLIICDNCKKMTKEEQLEFRLKKYRK